MTKLEDIEVRAADGMTLRGRRWRRPDPRGVVVIAHGYGEHGGTYETVAQMLSATVDLDVLAVDFRGHGRSPGRRGVVRQYEELVRDLHDTVKWAARELPGVHRFLLGHSNGGQVALRLALTEPESIHGLVVSNPAFRIALPVPPAKIRLGRFLARHAPWITLNAQLRTELMTRDPEVQREQRADRLRHNRISPPLFFGMVEGGEMLIARAGEIHTPTLMLIGGQDPVLDPAAAREFFDRLGAEDKSLLIYPKMLHDTLHDVGKEQVIDDLVRWLESRLVTIPSGPAASRVGI
jgi:alpha-beta hydrolase superfamily lysophospholipase